MEFSARGEQSHLHYVITFDSKLPLVGGLIKLALQSSIERGLAKHAQR
jgi:hypothetical protein